MELQFMGRDGEAAVCQWHDGVRYRVPLRARAFSPVTGPNTPHRAWFGVGRAPLWALAQDWVGQDGMEGHVAASRSEALEFAFSRLEEVRTVYFLGARSELEVLPSNSGV